MTDIVSSMPMFIYTHCREVVSLGRCYACMFMYTLQGGGLFREVMCGLFREYACMFMYTQCREVVSLGRCYRGLFREVIIPPMCVCQCKEVVSLGRSKWRGD